MKPLVLIGVILIVLGVAGFVVKRVTYTTNTSKVELGPVELTASEKRSIDIPDVASGLAVVAGIVLVVAGSRSRPR